ncbi:putative mitochondrial hypothetical protein [Leptomonas pyrrhocoris]|uniref:FAD dependent oxidoreductase domain-containing protein n=1 Tax=Leptomonas pyrrhocoris TaxID=157538 RepID=A0A0N0DRK1_LEPPY|nr:putative mitochondrial hypothetical protein [Leptomonas pyrrhocoris]KPA74614.1 putative mitochondrial hypothetical protein [Leptomonas pyrrhocoris]|eukprot:XP_015653053.1 putative mitochondrial hypothetical protein [Leptomonas pyrrhocoris]
MYAVKPWGHVILVGSCIGTYAMGIGMRWRESNVTVVEQKANPSYEANGMRRCVMTAQTIKLLTDLGCTERRIHSVLRPARGWRFLAPDLQVLREGVTFPGCAPGETAYHCAEGSLLRTLRCEFLRFGGTVEWGTRAYDAFENNDGSDTWGLRKDYGLGANAEAILTMAKSTPLSEMLIAPDPSRIAVLFDVEKGVRKMPVAEVNALFGQNCDVAIVVGNGVAMHCWRCGAAECAWRLVCNASKQVCVEDRLDGVHDLLKEVVLSSEKRESAVCALPGTTPAIKDNATHFRVGLLGDGLLPVDPFEWRGDNARCMVEEASTVCRLFYGKKYHRGDVPSLLRGAEQDSISKRANLLQRDLHDAEHFLAVHPQLESEPSAPEARCVGV